MSITIDIIIDWPNFERDFRFEILVADHYILGHILSDLNILIYSVQPRAISISHFWGSTRNRNLRNHSTYTYRCFERDPELPLSETDSEPVSPIGN